MNARDELAEVISASLDSIFGTRDFGPAQQDYKLADAILAAGYVKHRTITTVEELDALPPMVSLYSMKTDHFWFWLPKNAPALVAWGTGGGYTYETDFIKFEAPLTVLHEGES